MNPRFWELWYVESDKGIIVPEKDGHCKRVKVLDEKLCVAEDRLPPHMRFAKTELLDAGIPNLFIPKNKDAFVKAYNALSPSGMMTDKEANDYWDDSLRCLFEEGY